MKASHISKILEIETINLPQISSSFPNKKEMLYDLPLFDCDGTVNMQLNTS